MSVCVVGLSKFRANVLPDDVINPVALTITLKVYVAIIMTIGFLTGVTPELAIDYGFKPIWSSNARKIYLLLLIGD